MSASTIDAMRALRRVVAALGILGLAACASNTTETVKQRTPAITDANSGNVDIQKRDLNQSDVRKRAAIRLQLAVSYFRDGQYNTALDELKQALNIDPNFADAHMVLALVYAELQQNDLADQSFRRALQIDPGNSDVNNNYGWFLCQHGREKDSLGYFETALKNPLYTQKAKPLQNAGVCASKLGDPARAEDYFRRSFEIDPGGAVSAYNLASIYYERKDLPRARFYVNQVNSTTGSTAASLWLGIRIERRLGNRSSEIALENQLERQFANSREAQLQRRGLYED